MRIGLIADTHMPGTLKALWPQALEAFQDVDVILHAGDLHTLEVVDELNRIAPVYVARGNGDEGIQDARLKDIWELELGGIRIAVIHRFPSPEHRDAAHLERFIERSFTAQSPELVVYGHTHLESIHPLNHRLLINPGSPTLPRNQSLRLGTIGMIDIEPAQVRAAIWHLTEGGFADHGEISARTLLRG